MGMLVVQVMNASVCAKITEKTKTKNFKVTKVKA